MVGRTGCRALHAPRRARPRERYEAGRLRQRPLLSPTAAPEPPGSL